LGGREMEPQSSIAGTVLTSTSKLAPSNENIQIRTFYTCCALTGWLPHLLGVFGCLFVAVVTGPSWPCCTGDASGRTCEIWVAT
jgi:hypothetical protein